MKILIIGTPRSGTTSLIRGIGSQKYFSIGEPYNYNIGYHKYENKYPLKQVSEYKKIVVKTLAYQIPKEKEGTDPTDFGVEFCSYFDKIILLDRINWDSHWISYVNLLKTLKQKWEYNTELGIDVNTPHTEFNPHKHWLSDSITEEDFKWAYEQKLDDKLKEQKKIIAGISEELNIPITYYEKLYGEDRMEAFEIINKWGLEDIDPFDLLDFLDPSKKYKRDKFNLI